ncbi:MAG: M12 family metallopeptidase [Bryobacterales bacterium]|nr:M12 family metallopeptidase [Bryobacterales bacterium]
MSYLDLGNVDAGSAVRQLGAVLALAAAVAATDIGSAQQFNPVARDIRTGVYRGHAVTYEVVDGLAIWDGDIILGTPEELSPDPSPTPGNTPDYRNKISVTSSKEKLWPGGIVPYVIDPELTNPHVPDAIRHWEQNTPIRFVERTDQPNWVRFTPSSKCAAPVGMIGGEQNVFLRESCDPGAVVHEIGHAVGLWHEHERSDRDSHVWARSHPLGRVDGFFYYRKDGPYAVASGPYDYGSIMHYQWVGAVRTIPPGIELGRGGQQLGKHPGTGLSAGDIDGVSRLYGTIPARTTVSTNVAGLLIKVDGQTYTAPHSFDWEPGSMHTIGVVSPQKHGIDFIRYLFAKWSDGGAQTHSVTASSETTVFIANFILQYRAGPNAEPPHGGTVRFDPPSVDGFYPRLAYVKAIAEPAEGFSFERWNSGVSSRGGGLSNNPVQTTAKSHKAFFTQQPLTTIDTTATGSRVLVDGVEIALPTNFGWEAGSTHTLGFGGLIREVQSPVGVPGRLIFKGWSDGGDATHDITVSSEPSTITANFTTQYFVDAVSRGPGTIVVQPSPSEGRYHDASTMVQLTAQPRTGSKFVSWLGDLSGTENPQSLLMDFHKYVRAFFIVEHSYESAQLTSGKPFHLFFGPGSSHPEGYNIYWIDVPRGATQLEIRLVTSTPSAEVDLYASRDIRPRTMIDENTEEIVGYVSQYSSTGPGGDETITITPASSRPLEPGQYFIAVHARKQGLSVQGSLTAEMTVSESVIAAKIPHFDIPVSLITTMEGETPPPQILEIRNSGRGTLDYQISTDQPWLSVWPDQGSSAGETETVEITVDPANIEPGAYEGTITISDRQLAGGFSGLFSKSSPPAWPVTVPVTLIVIAADWEQQLEDAITGDGGLAVDAQLRSPQDVAVDAAGNLFFSDALNRRIRKVDSSGTISTIAGTGVEGYSGDGGPAIDAQLSYPASLTVDADGNLFIADTGTQRIRRVDSSGIVTTIAGTGVRGFAGDGGPAIQAQIDRPRGVAVDAAGNLFIADSRNRRIRKVDPSGNISTFPRGYSSDGVTLSGSPAGVAVDSAGNLFFTNTTNSNVFRVDPSGTITQIAGIWRSGYSGDGGPAINAHLRGPSDVTVDAAGNLYIADEYNYRIRRVDSSGIITTIAGTGVRGFSGDGGPAVQAQLAGPRGVAVDTAGNLYIADHGNHRIRKVDPSGTITTVAGSGEVEQ